MFSFIFHTDLSFPYLLSSWSLPQPPSYAPIQLHRLTKYHSGKQTGDKVIVDNSENAYTEQ